MNKKGSILIIGLWITAILAVFVVGLGFRSLTNLRVARYQRNRLAAALAAKAGINRAVAELDNDANDYDGILEPWSTGSDSTGNIFTDIYIKKESAGSFSVIITDEERKINLNRTEGFGRSEIKEALAEEPDAETLTGLIARWIGSGPGSDSKEQAVFKNAPLKTLQEAMLIFEYFYADKQKAQDLYRRKEKMFSLFPEKVNINTVSQERLLILLKSAGFGADAENAALAIISARDAKAEKAFASIDEIESLRQLEQYIEFSSNYFLIKSVGSWGKAKKEINAVYDRKNHKFVSWQEN